MPARRLIACDSFDRVLDDVAALRRGGYTRLGTWSLPQVCRHLAVPVELVLTPPTTLEQTDEQAAAWRQLRAAIASPGGLPPGRPLPSTALDPPADCTDAECDRLAAAYAAFAAYPHTHVTSPRFGPIPVAESRQFHLAHANHHLSFLVPTPTGRPDLDYPDVAAVVADVTALRRGYVRTGHWTLAQIAYHLAATLRVRMQPGDFPPDTPEQLARRPLLDRVLAENRITAGLTAPAAIARRRT